MNHYCCAALSSKEPKTKQKQKRHPPPPQKKKKKKEKKKRRRKKRRTTKGTANQNKACQWCLSSRPIGDSVSTPRNSFFKPVLSAGRQAMTESHRQGQTSNSSSSIEKRLAKRALNTRRRRHTRSSRQQPRRWEGSESLLLARTTPVPSLYTAANAPAAAAP